MKTEKQAETKDTRDDAECKSCRYSHIFSVGTLADDRWECRRYPPSSLSSMHTTGVSGGSTNYEFPDVFKGDWCGEFKKMGTGSEQKESESTEKLISNMLNKAVKDAVEIMTQRISENIK